MTTYRLMCDGIDVDVDGNVLHLSNPKATEKDIDAAVKSFRLMLEEQAKQPPPEPPPDYAVLYAGVALDLATATAEKAVLEKEREANAEVVKKYEATMEAVKAIDPKATKEDILKALDAATAMTADEKPEEP